ncbi:hypothetical protein SEEA8691_03292, partial [Salmonella enterica subsp. enterica serovar Agona str. 392869-1]
KRRLNQFHYFLPAFHIPFKTLIVNPNTEITKSNTSVKINALAANVYFFIR